MISKEVKLPSMGYLIRRYFWRFWKQSLILVTLSIVGAALTGLQPLLLAPALDASMPSSGSPASKISELNLNNIGATLLNWFSISNDNNPASLIVVVVILFIVIGIVAALADFLAHMLSNWVHVRANSDLQADLYKHLLNLDMQFYLRNRASELTSRFIIDAAEVTLSLDLSIRQILQSMFQIIIYGFLLFQTSGRLALAVVAISAVHFLINRVLKYRIQQSTSDRFDRLADTGSILNESFSNIRVIKCFTAETQENQRFRSLLDQLERITIQNSFYKHTDAPLRRITDTVALALMLVLSFMSLKSGALSTSGFIMFMVVVRQTIAPISTFAQSLIRLHGVRGSARRVLELLKIQLVQKQGQLELSAFNDSIQFKGVCFGYDATRTVLRNINFSLKKGEVLAVVGASGAGKTTMADLLVRLFDPQEGEILIDGVPITEYSLKSYRQLFGVVPQESLLNHLTVSENIAFGDRGGTCERLAHSIQIANAKEFIEHLPQKLDTPIGDRGVRISGGQRQRLAIARAIYVNPKILVLDEATSELDSQSEKLVQVAITEMLKDGTAFIIAHRLSTIKHADRILVLNAGEIEMIGTHEFLMKNSVTYKTLYELQDMNTDTAKSSKGISEAFNPGYK